MKNEKGIDFVNIWNERYKDKKLACTKRRNENDPIDYTQHPFLYKHSIAKRLTGSLDGNVMETIAAQFMTPPLGKVLAIGSGMAYGEEFLVTRGFVQHIVAYESSSVAVEAARLRLAEAGLGDKIEIRCDDVMKADIPSCSFDAVFIQAAIHHFFDIEAMFQLFYRVLKPAGLLIYSEYIGPDHHLYEPFIMNILDEIDECLSDDLRWDVLRQETRRCVPRATREWMLNMDPSEGVHSSRILPLTYKYFDVVFRGDWGGTIMRPFWTGILPNFDFSEKKDATIARLIILMEDLLIRHGIIPHYHTNIVGRRLSTPNDDLTQEEESRLNFAEKSGNSAGCNSGACVLTNYTDDNWVKGIAKNWATAFFVQDSLKAKSDFAIGRKVTFADGTTRSIIQLKENAGSLIVYLDGAPLDGNTIGYPKEIKVSDITK